MAMQLHWFKGRMLIVGLAALLLAGCGEDYGIDQDGRKVTAESLEGQWLLINYWATWCAPCRAETSEFNQLTVQLKGQPVQVLGVNFDGLQGAELSKASASAGGEF